MVQTEEEAKLSLAILPNQSDSQDEKSARPLSPNPRFFRGLWTLGEGRGDRGMILEPDPPFASFSLGKEEGIFT